MSRKERENMIEFISKMKGIEERKLMIMTDEEVEYIYHRLYQVYELAE